MAAKRMNVLIYSGTGSTVDAVKHAVFTFRRLLSADYAVIPIEGNAIIKEPWMPTCALLVMPGGADLGYCRILNGEGNRRIRSYVEQGGAYLGFCAGAYYGSGKCEFEVGNKLLEVIGSRELAFFPGVCRGLAFTGFEYNSEAGARAAELEVSTSALSQGSAPVAFRSYYNGGGVFVDAAGFHPEGVEILAAYTESLKVHSGPEKAAVIYCKIGSGGVILCNTHPEFAAANLDHSSRSPSYNKLIKALQADDEKRVEFLKSCILKLGLVISQGTTVPSLSRLHLSSVKSSGVKDILRSLEHLIINKDGASFLECENDRFLLEQSNISSQLSSTSLLDAKDEVSTDASHTSDDRFPNYDKILKKVTLHDEAAPTPKETPYFNHQSFFANLRAYSGGIDLEESTFGRHLLYGEVVSSTNTMLEKNPKLLCELPTGFTACATTQLAGRGRGSNVWVSPAGSLIFSTVIRHPNTLTTKAPVIFLQYLAALAIVKGIHTYDRGYQALPVKIKWPNDVYAFDPESKKYVKIAGILVNTHYNATDFFCVVGIGINAINAAPTTSLNALKPPSPFTLEKLLARILVTFSGLYAQFCLMGFDKSLETEYYSHWLHSDQIVTLETEGGVRARIKGITTDWGLLLAEELGWEDRPTGKIFQLQSDSNSFDFFKGLVKRKL